MEKKIIQFVQIVHRMFLAYAAKEFVFSVLKWRRERPTKSTLCESLGLCMIFFSTVRGAIFISASDGGTYKNRRPDAKT